MWGQPQGCPTGQSPARCRCYKERKCTDEGRPDFKRPAEKTTHACTSLQVPPWKSGPSGVQFHDILYKTFRDILYTRPAGIAVGVAILEQGCVGSNSQIRVRR